MKRIIASILLLSLLLCCGCAAQAEDAKIVASFYPVYILAQNVLRDVDGVTLSCMTAPSTGCLHDYQLLTSDMRTLSGAKALLINGAGMESFLPGLQEQLPTLEIVDCSQGVALLEEDCAEAGHDHDHGHDHGEYNAHIWLAPRNAMEMVGNMEEALSALLPESAEKIHANAAAYRAELDALDQELSAAIAALPHKKIVTFHEAFPYFAKAYGLEVAAVMALEPDEPLSPRMLAEVVDAVKAAGCPPLFTEPQYESAAVQAVSQETGAPVYALDPLVTGDGAMTAYQDVMRANLAVLQDALK